MAFRPARHHRGIDEEGEGRNHELRIPIGLQLGSGHKKGASYDNRNAWPVNSERARQLRRDFVQEGFRRLYRSADLHQEDMGDDGIAILLPRANGTMGSIVGTLIGAIRTTIGAIGSLANEVEGVSLAVDFSSRWACSSSTVITHQSSAL